jgi:squalene-associated FAD-dependent desaturase
MTCHVIGGGLAGLAAASALAHQGLNVVLYEAANHAGGRCRSFLDPKLGRIIDNGSHLVVSANHSVRRYVDLIGAQAEWDELQPAEFPFLDFSKGIAEWRLAPNKGRLPWWILFAKRRVKDTTPFDYIRDGARLRKARAGDSVADILSGPLMKRLWEPLCEAMLNCKPAEADAMLFRATLEASLGLGEEAVRPWIAKRGLSAGLVDPALAMIAAKGGEIRFGARLVAIAPGANGIRLSFEGNEIETAHDDQVILALPPWGASQLLPELPAPQSFKPIVNAHFLLPEPRRLPGGLTFLGVIGLTGQWFFIKEDVLSITVSAADALAKETPEAVAAILWSDSCRVLGLPDGAPLPPHRVIKEQRATPAQTVEEMAKRQAPNLRHWPEKNLFLAGDWTIPELPATIEAAIRSGFRASSLALKPRL